MAKNFFFVIGVISATSQYAVWCRCGASLMQCNSQVHCQTVLRQSATCVFISQKRTTSSLMAKEHTQCYFGTNVVGSEKTQETKSQTAQTTQCTSFSYMNMYEQGKLVDLCHAPHRGFLENHYTEICFSGKR